MKMEKSGRGVGRVVGEASELYLRSRVELHRRQDDLSRMPMATLHRAS